MSAQSTHLADLERRLAGYGVTGSGREWLLKALHPAGASPCPGLPDLDTTAVVRPEYRDQIVISAPVGASTWDCLIWRPPGNVNVAVIAYGPSPMVFNQAGTPTGGVVTVLACQPTYDLSGDVITSLDGIYGSRWPTSRPVAFRHTYAGLTAYLTAATLADQGSVYAAQFASSPMNAHTTLAQQATNTVTGHNLLANLHLSALPFDENSLLLLSPEAYTGPAKDGVYLPLRLNGPSQPFAYPAMSACFLDQALNFGTVQSGNYSLPSVGFNQLYNTNSIANAFCWVNDSLLTGTTNGLSTGYDNISQGVIIFRGLAGTLANSPASITLKSYSGLEVVPAADSPERQFARVGAAPDLKAMEAYYHVVHQLPDAYPANFNSLGTILSSIGEVASKIWPVVRGIGAAIVPAIDQATGFKPPKPPVEAEGTGLERKTPWVPKPKTRSIRSRSVASTKRRPRTSRRRRAPSSSRSVRIR